MAEIKSGEVVRIRSGGPKMTAEKVDDGTVACCWFVKKRLVREAFQLAALEVVGKSKVDYGDTYDT